MLLGQHISASELERETSSWPPDRFVSMCNLLIWAYSGRTGCVPVLTERVNAKDGGIDAEIEVPDESSAIPSPILRSGRNIFQYKLRDVIAQNRRKIVSGLRQKLRGSLLQIQKERSRHPDAYTLITNIDLSGPDTSAIRQSIEENASDSHVHTQVVGAGLLATMLNDNPHIRAAYFAPDAFRTWQDAESRHREAKLLDASIDLIGRDEELKRVKAWVDDPGVRIIVLSGPHDCGKTRLALEATRHRASEVVVALDPRSMKPGDYACLFKAGGKGLCIVEDPPLDGLDLLLSEAPASGNLKLLITFAAPQKILPPRYGLDTGFQTLHLQGLSDEDSRRLIRALKQSLDFGVEDWIVEQSGGLPGVLLAAASVGRDLRSSSVRLGDAVGRELEHRILTSLDPESVDCARLLSALTFLGVKGDRKGEIANVRRIFRPDLPPDQIDRLMDELEQAGFVKRRGSFAEITPPILANHLARQLFKNSTDKILALFACVDQEARIRLIERICQAGGDEADQTAEFGKMIFAADGPVADLNKALNAENAPLLKYLAAAMPDRVLWFLRSHLKNSSLEYRSSVDGTPRRELMWALEQLLFRSETSSGALRLIWLLAEAENENYGNSATQVLKECFFVFHPQLPLPHRERLEILSTFTQSENPKMRRLVGIRAAADALDSASIILRRSLGPDPLGTGPPLTWPEARDYAQRLGDLFLNLAENPAEDPHVCAAVLEALPQMASALARVAPERAIPLFERLVQLVRASVAGIDVARVAAALRHSERLMTDRLGQIDAPAERSEVEDFLKSLKGLRSSLESADFDLRLRNWTGEWVSLDPELMEEKADGQTPYMHAIEDLAREAVESPQKLTPELVQQLQQDSAERSHLFFHCLGRIDCEHLHLEKVDGLASQDNGSRSFASYLGGWATRDSAAAEAAEEHLQKLTESNRATGQSILLATSWMRPTASAVSRVIKELDGGRIEAASAEMTLHSGWMRKLAPADFERLIRTIAGRDLTCADLAVRMYGKWMHLNREITEPLAALGWQCLQAWHITNSQTEYHFDLLAARLSKSDPASGFELLRRYFQEGTQGKTSDQRIWNPLGHHGRPPKMWETLHDNNTEQLYRILIEQARRGELEASQLSWRLRELVNLAKDAEVLLLLARESVESARIVARWLNGDREGFWPLVFDLHKLHPADPDLHEYLASAIERRDSVFVGRLSDQIASIAAEVESRIKDPLTPPTAIEWLREIEYELSRQIGREIIWEYDLDIEHLKNFVSDRNSPQRLWAIGRILKHAKIEDIRELLTVDDIEDALLQTDLPSERRRILQQAIPIWRYGK